MSPFEMLPFCQGLRWFSPVIFLHIVDLATDEEDDIGDAGGWSDDERYLWLYETAVWDQRIDEMLLDLVGNLDSGLL